MPYATPHAVGVIALLLATSSCAAKPSGERNADAGATGRLRVTQHQTDCCYIEGQVSYLVVRTSWGGEVVRREFVPFGDEQPVVDLPLEPGSYVIESYQRPCDGNCALLDPPTDRCKQTIHVRAGEAWFVTASFAPGAGCQMARTASAPASSVPDAYAVRESHENCGLDYGFQLPDSMGMKVMRPSSERDCLLDAFTDRRASELTAYEPGAVPDRPEFVVYRTGEDGGIDELRARFDRNPDGVWAARRCTGLAEGGPLGFTLTGCRIVPLATVAPPDE